MGETKKQSIVLSDLKIFLALVVGVAVGVFTRDHIRSAVNVVQKSSVEEADYDIEEIQVDYLQMLDGVKGVAFDVVNGVKVVCKCESVHPEGGLIVYTFKGYIGDEKSAMVQQFQFNYTVKPVVSNGMLTLFGGDTSRVFLEPENIIVGSEGMKRIIDAFAVPQLKSFETYVAHGAFGIKELYSKMIVVKVAKEKK